MPESLPASAAEPGQSRPSWRFHTAKTHLRHSLDRQDCILSQGVLVWGGEYNKEAYEGYGEIYNAKAYVRTRMLALIEHLDSM